MENMLALKPTDRLSMDDVWAHEWMKGETATAEQTHEFMCGRFQSIRKEKGFTDDHFPKGQEGIDLSNMRTCKKDASLSCNDLHTSVKANIVFDQLLLCIQGDKAIKIIDQASVKVDKVNWEILFIAAPKLDGANSKWN